MAWALSRYSTAWTPACRAPATRSLAVIEEHHLRWISLKAFAGQSVDPGIGLAHPALVGVDDLIDQVLESVGGLFSFPGTDEAVTHDPGAVSRAQPALRSRSVLRWRSRGTRARCHP